MATICTEKDRSKLRGGGLILYINEELTKCEFEESLWCNIELDRQRLLVGLCYRNPISTADNNEKLLL